MPNIWKTVLIFNIFLSTTNRPVTEKKNQLHLLFILCKDGALIFKYWTLTDQLSKNICLSPLQCDAMLRLFNETECKNKSNSLLLKKRLWQI